MASVAAVKPVTATPPDEVALVKMPDVSVPTPGMTLVVSLRFNDRSNYREEARGSNIADDFPYVHGRLPIINEEVRGQITEQGRAAVPPVASPLDTA